jgi:hypothetical protein
VVRGLKVVTVWVSIGGGKAVGQHGIAASV